MVKRLMCGDAAVACDDAPATPLIRIVRQRLRLLSVTWGCRNGSCGTCRVLLDGVLTKSCERTLQDVADGARIEALEHVRDLPEVQAALQAFDDDRPTRCELCVGAVGVCAAALARAGASSDPAAVEAVVAGATCQCTGRASLRRSLLRRPGER